MTAASRDTEELIAAAEAAEAEFEAADDITFVRTRARAKDPSQVYSVRIPVDQIDRLRSTAEERGIGPTVLMRQWVLERLGSEELAGSNPEQRLVEVLAEAARLAEVVQERAAQKHVPDAPRVRAPSVRLGPTRRLVVR